MDTISIYLQVACMLLSSAQAVYPSNPLAARTQFDKAREFLTDVDNGLPKFEGPPPVEANPKHNPL